MKVFLRIVRRLCPIFRSLWRIATGELRLTYSQYGEDAMLKGFVEDRILDPDYKGFWVDIGAHHPDRFSNTKMYYDCGWRGINVDALPAAIKIFDNKRPRDINVNVGIGETPGTLEYFMFADYATNTFSREFAEKVMARGVSCIGVTKVDVITLKDLMRKYLPPKQHIDFFSIDTEGLDISILRSNDWALYRPDYILIEIHTEGHNENVIGGAVHQYLQKQGYEFAAQGLCTTLFKRVR